MAVPGLEDREPFAQARAVEALAALSVRLERAAAEVDLLRAFAEAGLHGVVGPDASIARRFATTMRSIETMLANTVPDAGGAVAEWYALAMAREAVA